MAKDLVTPSQMFYMHIDAGVMHTCYVGKYIGPLYDGFALYEL